MSLIIPNAKLFDRDLLTHAMMPVGEALIAEIPSIYRQVAKAIFERCWEKHNGYVKIGLDAPFRPRTRRAQGKFHAIIGSLAPLVDMTFDDCKRYVKMEATAIGYPMQAKLIFKGTSRERFVSEPKSEADASTKEEALLIETALKLGAEAGHDLEAEYEMRMAGM